MKFRSILEDLANDRMDNVFDTFNVFFETIGDAKDEVLILKSRYESLRGQERSDTIDPQELARGVNKIRKAILKIYGHIESTMDDADTSAPKSDLPLTDQSKVVLQLVQETVSDRGYEIISQVFSDLSSYYFLAKRISYVQKDYYIIQVLNWHKIIDSELAFNQYYLDFFSGSVHPFVNLLEFHPGNPSYIIRKYAEGINLHNLISSGITLSLVKALDMVSVITKGLKEMDDATIFYNNLIPDQIILNNKLDLHLLPLNIFEENENIVTWKKLKNGIKFMSPEQLALAGNKEEQKKLRLTSNQYSLGLILFFTLTGELLFDGKGLPGLYEDRINTTDTTRQLDSLYELVHQSLLQYGIKADLAKTLTKTFIHIFTTLLSEQPKDRYRRTDNLIADIDLLKLQIEKERNKAEDDIHFQVSDSFYRAMRLDDELVDSLYEELQAQLTYKNSMAKANERNVRFQYALNYLFTSIANFNQEDHLVAALSGLVKGLHFDFTVDEYEVFFKLLQAKVTAADPDWNEATTASWNTFIELVLDGIDTILEVGIG